MDPPAFSPVGLVRGPGLCLNEIQFFGQNGHGESHRHRWKFRTRLQDRRAFGYNRPTRPRPKAEWPAAVANAWILKERYVEAAAMERAARISDKPYHRHRVSQLWLQAEKPEKALPSFKQLPARPDPEGRLAGAAVQRAPDARRYPRGRGGHGDGRRPRSVQRRSRCKADPPVSCGRRPGESGPGFPGNPGRLAKSREKIEVFFSLARMPQIG